MNRMHHARDLIGIFAIAALCSGLGYPVETGAGYVNAANLDDSDTDNGTTLQPALPAGFNPCPFNWVLETIPVSYCRDSSNTHQIYGWVSVQIDVLDTNPYVLVEYANTDPTSPAAVIVFTAPDCNGPGSSRGSLVVKPSMQGVAIYNRGSDRCVVVAQNRVAGTAAPVQLRLVQTVVNH